MKICCCCRKDWFILSGAFCIKMVVKPIFLWEDRLMGFVSSRETFYMEHLSRTVMRARWNGKLISCKYSRWVCFGKSWQYVRLWLVSRSDKLEFACSKTRGTESNTYSMHRYFITLICKMKRIRSSLDSSEHELRCFLTFLTWQAWEREDFIILAYNAKIEHRGLLHILHLQSRLL